MSAIGLWEIAILALLRESPMHPYEMKRLLQERHTAELLPLKRGSLYHAIKRLAASGFIEAAATDRDGRRPERTTYRLTPAGEPELLGRLRRELASPETGSAEFMTCISFLVHLAPRDARAQLAIRAAALEADITQQEAGLRAVGSRVSRIHLVEIDYWLALRRTEVSWMRGLIADIDGGRLDWNPADILAGARDARSATED